MDRTSGVDESLRRPLSSLPAGTRGVVVALAGGRRFTQQVVGMGLHPGRRIEVIRSGNGRRGPCLIASGQTRLVIGHGMAERILVEVV